MNLIPKLNQPRTRDGRQPKLPGGRNQSSIVVKQLRPLCLKIRMVEDVDLNRLFVGLE
jgi:hypothetical protein